MHKGLRRFELRDSAWRCFIFYRVLYRQDPATLPPLPQQSPEHQVFGGTWPKALSLQTGHTESSFTFSTAGREGRKEGEKAGRHPDLRPWFSRISYGDHALLCHNVNTKARFQGLGRALWLLDICFLLSPFPHLGG